MKDRSYFAPNSRLSFTKSIDRDPWICILCKSLCYVMGCEGEPEHLASMEHEL